MHSLLHDIRYACRSLRQRPLFTVIAALTLALGIGVNTAIFSVFDAVVLRPLTYRHPEQLVEVVNSHDNQLSFPNFRDLRAQVHSFSSMVPFRYWLFNLSGSDHPQSLLGVYVGDALLSTLGVQPMLGRGFSSGAEVPGYPREAVISHALWQQRFGGDRRVVGTTAVIDGVATTIVGVMPAEFQFPDLVPAGAPLPSRRPDVFLPLGIESGDDFNQRSNDNFWVIGRLGPGVGFAAAAADLARVGRGLAHDYPGENAHLTLAPVPLKQEITGGVQRPLGILSAAVALVLLIACANVGGLLLARALERRRELAIRTALGASPRRLIRQMLTESLVLALLGGGLGVALAAWGVVLIRAIAPSNLPRIDSVALNARALLYALAGSLLTGLLFGLVPVLQRRRSEPGLELRDRGGAGGVASRRLRGVLVIAELGLAVVLLTGAGLLLRSFVSLQAIQPGFDAPDVMTMFTLLPPSRYGDDRQMAKYEQRTLAALDALPGVISASAINTLPLSNLGNNTSVDVVGHLASSPAERPGVAYRILGGPYFQTMGMKVVAGRDFTAADTAGAPPVMIINQAAARRLFPGQDPLGREIIEYNGDEHPKRVVGVVADVHGVALDSAATPEVNTPYRQGADVLISLAIRTRGDPRSMLPAIRHALGAVDPDQAFYAERTMGELLSASLAVRRFDMVLLGSFAALALVLAAVGLYGVIAFSVSQRTREIGIRAALGAEGGRIAFLVLREGAALGAAGLLLGLLASLAATRALRGLLFGIGATDPVTYAGVLAFLAVVVLLACYLPARRASRVDPVVALRD